MSDPFYISMRIPEDLYKVAPEYDGYVHGTNECSGESEIEFPSHKLMGEFVENNGLESRTRVLHSSTYYGEVMISVSVAPH